MAICMIITQCSAKLNEVEGEDIMAHPTLQSVDMRCANESVFVYVCEHKHPFMLLCRILAQRHFLWTRNCCSVLQHETIERETVLMMDQMIYSGTSRCIAADPGIYKDVLNQLMLRLSWWCVPILLCSNTEPHKKTNLTSF